MNSVNTGGMIDFRDILSLIWRRKWLMVLPVPIIAAIALAISYLITPQYESRTIIQIDPQVQLIGDLQRLVSDPTGRDALSGSNRSNMLRSIYNDITSSNYAELLDERMHLTRQQHIQEQAQEWVQLQPEMAIELARLMVLQAEIKDNVSVEWASGDQVRIIMTSVSAVQARDMANHLGDLFIAEKIKEDLNQIRSSQDFSDVQLERYERQVEDKMSEIADVEQRLARLRNADDLNSETNRAEIQGEIDQTVNEIDELRQEERSIMADLRNVEGLNTGELSLQDSDAGRAARGELQRRLSQIGELLSRLAWNNPQVLNFKLRQNELLSNIESENVILVNEQFDKYNNTVRRDLVRLFNTQARLDYLYTKKPYLESTLADLTPAMEQIPILEANLAQLEREVQVATDIRDGFRVQQESSSISQALLEDRSSTKYRKVEPAKLALQPFTPNRQKILAMGIILGIALGAGVVLMVELLDNSFKKVEDVEAILGLKVIGITPKVEFDKRLIRR